MRAHGVSCSQSVSMLETQSGPCFSLSPKEGKDPRSKETENAWQLNFFMAIKFKGESWIRFCTHAKIHFIFFIKNINKKISEIWINPVHDIIVLYPKLISWFLTLLGGYIR